MPLSKWQGYFVVEETYQPFFKAKLIIGKQINPQTSVLLPENRVFLTFPECASTLQMWILYYVGSRLQWLGHLFEYTNHRTAAPAGTPWIESSWSRGHMDKLNSHPLQPETSEISNRSEYSITSVE